MKYNNSKVQTPNGEIFDSVKEYKRWLSLRTMQDRGQISELDRQVKFELIPSQWETVERYGRYGQRLKDGKKCVEAAINYIADFTYKDKDGNLIVEDVKGVRDAKYIIKRKLMLYLKGIKILET